MSVNYRIQRLICVYFQEWIPYFEPLRALNLPDPDAPYIRNSPKKVRCCETRTMDCERGERQLIAVLDASYSLAEATIAVKNAMEGLTTFQRDSVALLARNCSSELIFDFEKAAHAWTTARRGILPDSKDIENTPFYSSWCSSKHEKKRSLEKLWKKVYPRIATLLVPFLIKN